MVIKRTVSTFTILVMLAVLLLSIGCSLDKSGDTAQPTQAPAVSESNKVKGNPVVISSKNIDYTLYDFRNAYYSNQYYMYMLYGAITPSDYFDIVVMDASSVVCIYNAAIENGVQLDSDEYAAFEEDFNSQLENIISQYKNDVDESITDDDLRREEAIKLLNEDLAADGLDYETFIELARKNLLMYKITDKYYEQLREEIELSEDDIIAYFNEQLESSEDISMISFKDAYEAYAMGSGAFPVYIPDDCFSVNHILLLFDQFSEDGSTGYDTQSRNETEAELESAIANAADFEAFMALENEYGEDPGMDDEGYRENGYIIHGDYDNYYYPGFVYAAMNLYYGSWSPSDDVIYEIPDIEFFELLDGTKVVKVATEPGIHYIIVNKEFKKGAVEYEIGDARWLSWRDELAETKLDAQYEKLLEQWKLLYPLTDYSDAIRSEFVQDDDGSEK